MHDVGMIAQVMHEMAQIHAQNGHNPEASKIFKQELAIRKKMGKSELARVAKTLHHLGLVELEMRNHTKALNYFMEALSTFEKQGGDLGVEFAETLYGTGLVFQAMRHDDRAREAYREALKIFKSKGVSDSNPRVTAAADKLKLLGHDPSPSKSSRIPKQPLTERAAC